jgi:uncharacterized membrane protein YccC
LGTGRNDPAGPSITLAESARAGNDGAMTTTLGRTAWLPAVSPRVWEAVGFAVRTWLASMLALYVAYALQLDAPYWSWLTVWIVAQPSPGMLLSKSVYRVIGTLSGAFIAVILISLFAQTPDLFILALALVVGGFTVASNVLTNFRAYATVLAAYTAGIVASDAINDPNQIFFIATARGAAILIGIASAIVVTSIFAPHRSEDQVRGKLLALLKDASRRAAYSWKADNKTRLEIGRKLIVDSIALNTLVEFAAAESGVFRLQRNHVHSLLAHVFGMISARRSLDAHLHRCGWPRHNALEIFHEVIIDFLDKMPAKLERGEVDDLIGEAHDVRAQLARLQPEEDTVSPEELGATSCASTGRKSPVSSSIFIGIFALRGSTASAPSSPSRPPAPSGSRAPGRTVRARSFLSPSC